MFMLVDVDVSGYGMFFTCSETHTSVRKIVTHNFILPIERKCPCRQFAPTMSILFRKSRLRMQIIIFILF